MDDEDWELVARRKQNRLILTRRLYEAGVRTPSACWWEPILRTPS